MKKIFSVFCALILCTFVFAQLQNTNWCFGTNAKVNFTGTPVASSCSINLATNGGVDIGSVSDQNGNLLFYTNGHEVWGRDNVIMPNGNNLYTTTAGIAALQYVSIVAKPNHPNLFYIFNISSGITNSHIDGHEGAYYSVVDMSLNGGNGDIVVGKKNIALKNDLGQLLDYDYNNGTGIQVKQGEITSTLHKDGDKVWVVFMLTFHNSGVPNRYLYSYLVTENGINNAADGINHMPNGTNLLDNVNYPSSNLFYDWFGYMKISPNGLYLGIALPDAVNLYNFNNQTGFVTFNSQIYSEINTPGFNTGYGVEFSPNSQFIYFSAANNTLYQQGKIINPVTTKKYVKIYQNKIGSNLNEIIGKIDMPDLQISSTTPFSLIWPSSLQLSIDGKIYICSGSYPLGVPQYGNLGAIRFPNLSSTACDFTISEILLAPNTNHWGSLPQLVHATGKWPKAYATKPTQSMFITDNGNLVVTFAPLSGSPYLNHTGIYLPNASNSFTMQYTLNGFTNWNSNIYPFFPLHNGSIQMSDHNFYNSTTGSLTTGPLMVPPNERIIAQTTDGSYISSNEINSICWGCGFFVGQIYIHTATGQTSAPLNINYYAKTIFNPVTNMLYVNKNNVLYSYSISGNTFSLLNQTSFVGDLVQITNTDKVYVIHNNQLVELLSSGSYGPPLSILGFNNNSLGTNYASGTISDNPYTENKVLVTNTANNFIYSIDLINMVSKKIQVSSTPYYNSRYAYHGDDVYLTFSVEAPFVIGNQQIPLFGTSGTLCGFTKLNLLSDFSRASSNLEIIESHKAETPKTTFDASISPNPSKDNIRIEIKTNDKTDNNQTYTIQFKNQVTNRTITKRNYNSGGLIDISSFEKGFHFVEIMNNNGEILAVKFLKM